MEVLIYLNSALARKMAHKSQRLNFKVEANPTDKNLWSMMMKKLSESSVQKNQIISVS